MDEAVKKKVLRKIQYGLFVATSFDPSSKNSASGTVNWVTQVSFKPPCVAVAIKKDTGLHKVISASGFFALNVVGKGQKDMAQTFFKGYSVENGKLAGYEIFQGETGAPIIKDSAGAFECKVIQKIDFGGDHDLFIGEVVASHLCADLDPLPMSETGWYYGG